MESQGLDSLLEGQDHKPWSNKVSESGVQCTGIQFYKIETLQRELSCLRWT